MGRSTPAGRKPRKAVKASQHAKAKKPAPPPPDLERDRSHVGRRVSKYFGRDLYGGVVKKFVQRHRLWKIEYEDGDSEEMDWNDLSNAIELHERKSGKKKKGGEGGKKREDGGGAAAAAAAAEVTPAAQDEESAAGADEAAVPTVAAGGAPAPAEPAKFRVVRCYAAANDPGTIVDRFTVGEYATRRGADEAARAEVGAMPEFRDWAEDRFEGRGPPYRSADGPPELVAGEDEHVEIRVVDLEEEEAAERRDLEEARASKPPASPAKVAPAADGDGGSASAAAVGDSKPPSRSFGRTTEEIVVDANLFARNPCRIPGGTSRHPRAYPNYHKGKGSFGFLIQRLSDRNYAMRALCLDGHGARYNTYKKRGVNYISVVWYPPTNLNDHADDATVVDGCHLDLIDPDDGKTCLTGPVLESVVRGAARPAECVFLNGAESNRHSVIGADDIARAVGACEASLKCVSLTECKLDVRLLAALARCGGLRGIIVENCQLWGDRDADRPSDDGLARVLRSCPELRWAFVKSSLFSARCWEALDSEGVCPRLEVLWVDAPVHTEERVDAARGDHDTIRSALEKRAGTLKLCMINPDGENESRYVVGGGDGTDRLNGRARTEEEMEAVRMMQDFHRKKSADANYVNTV